MNFSTSSALLPGHWVIMVTFVFVTSGKASTGVCVKDIAPAKTMIYEDGKILTKDLPLDIKRKFELAGIKNPFLKENEE